jgi:hypothetical protein
LFMSVRNFSRNTRANSEIIGYRDLSFDFE